MATDNRMNHCKRCQKATLHISRGTSHLLHLVLSVMTLGVWMLVWILTTLLHSAESQCTECGRNRGSPLATLAMVALLMAVVLPNVWYAFNKDKSLAEVENEIGATQRASAPSPAPNSDGVLRGEFRYGRSGSFTGARQGE